MNLFENDVDELLQNKEILEDRIATLETEKEALREHLDDMTLQRNASVGKEEMYRAEARALRKRLSEIRQDWSEVEANHSNAERELGKLGDALYQARTERNKAREALTAEIAAHKAANDHVSGLHKANEVLAERIAALARQLDRYKPEAIEGAEALAFVARAKRWRANLKREAEKARVDLNFPLAGSLSAIEMCVTAILNGEEIGES